ncbi:MAG: LysM peptidoglycan-binding domain-containing protein [Myxococcota bacterium]
MRGEAWLAAALATALLVIEPGVSGASVESDGGAPPAMIEEFPLPDSLRTAVAFWMRVYLEVTTRAGLLHDSRNLGLVYETLRFERNLSPRTRQKRVDARKRHWRKVLRRLANGGQPDSPEEETVLRLLELELGHPPRPQDLRRAARRLRFQLGQRDKFREGIIRAGAYENVMRAIFRREALPEDLALLPHVESSFNLKAYSKYGAAGIWQFMRSTGRRFMRVDYIVDERLDPIASTSAAARLLKHNYESLGSWPLAITAYNHGVAGMRRAKRKLGTDDIAAIIERYRSRSFGFASRNFYAQFLAARKVIRSYESYFGPLRRDEPEPVDEITLPFFVDVKDLQRHLGVAPEVIQHYNLSLRPPVFRSGKRIPKGFVLRLPAGTLGADPERWIARIPPKRHFAAQHRSRYYTVRRGDTLGGIAKRHRTSVGRLVALNNLPSRHRIYPGQTLQLPEGASRRGSRRFAVIKPAQARPATQEPKLEIKPLPAPADQNGRLTVPDDSPFRRLEGDRVLVDMSETLGHFADWLELPASRLRKLNHLPRSRKLRFGKRLRLDFSRVDPETFLQRRIEFHKAIEEDFFGSYRVTGTIEHRLAPGDSLWILSLRRYRVPAWLIQAYNRDLDLTHLMPGQVIQIPVIEPTRDGGSAS